MASLKWTILSFPEIDDPSSNEPLLRAKVNSLSIQEIEKLLLNPDKTIKMLLRGHFLLGRMFYNAKKWDFALLEFEYCFQKRDKSDIALAVHLQRWCASAAHAGHHHEIAIGYYEATIQLMKANQDYLYGSYVQEDPDTLICNLLREESQAWVNLAVFTPGRNLLALQALPLINERLAQQPTPHNQEAITQSEKNWRILSIFARWSLVTLIRWQARLETETSLYDDDLEYAEKIATEALNLSKVMVEGRSWTANLHTLRAEIIIQRCRLTLDQPELPLQRSLLCIDANKHLATISKPKIDIQNPVLDDLVLTLPWIELEWCQLLADDARHFAPDILRKIEAILEYTEKIIDPSYQTIAAQYAWLAGTIARDCMPLDDEYKAKARAYFQHALSLIKKGDVLQSLLEKVIQRDLDDLDELDDVDELDDLM